jgi:hypothetical protein
VSSRQRVGDDIRRTHQTDAGGNLDDISRVARNLSDIWIAGNRARQEERAILDDWNGRSRGIVLVLRSSYSHVGYHQYLLRVAWLGVVGPL